MISSSNYDLFSVLLSVNDVLRESCAKFLQFGTCFMTILISFKISEKVNKMFNCPGLALTSGLSSVIVIFPLLGDNLIILMGSGEYVVQGDLCQVIPCALEGNANVKCQFRKLNYATNPVGCQDRLYA